MYFEYELLKYLLERKAERLSVDRLYAESDEEKLCIDAQIELLEDLELDTYPYIEDLEQLEENYFTGSDTYVTGLPDYRTYIGKDFEQFFKINHIPTLE